MLTLAPIAIQAIQAGIQLAPEIIAAVQQEIELVNSGAVPTSAQQAAIDAALDAAHATLQSA